MPRLHRHDHRDGRVVSYEAAQSAPQPTRWSHWSYVDRELPDPKGRPLAEVRATRDDIARRVHAVLTQLDRGRALASGGDGAARGGCVLG